MKWEFLISPANPEFLRTNSLLISARYGILLKQLLTSQQQNAKRKVYTFLMTPPQHYGISQADSSSLANKLPTLTDMASIVNVHTSYFNEMEAE